MVAISSQIYLPVKRLVFLTSSLLVASISTNISKPSSMTSFTKASGNLALLNTTLFFLDVLPDLLDDGVFACPRDTGVTGKVSSCRPSFDWPSGVVVESRLTSKKYCSSGRHIYIRSKFKRSNQLADKFTDSNTDIYSKKVILSP